MSGPEKTDSHNRSPDGETTFIMSLSGHRHQYVEGDVVDGVYQLRSLLGAGGMGVVFACRHLVLGQEYAIKILSADQLSEESWSRFRSEAQALAKLNHPNIVGIYNMGIDKGQFPYFVMDLLSGETLDVVVARKKNIAEAEVLDMFIQIADALSSAHANGIIHRDIKPSNIVLLPGPRGPVPKVVDFGIARLNTQGLAGQSQTKTGMIFGTPFYMSPEQCQGHRVDERSDIYSLGCAFFECLAGKPPFRGENRFQTFMLHQTEPPPSLLSAAPHLNFNPALDAAVAKMLAKNPGERYQAMAQIKHDLERIKAGKSIMAQGQTGTSQALPQKTAAFSATPASPINHHDDDYEEAHTSQFSGGLSPAKIAAFAAAGLLLCSGVAAAFYFILNPPRSAADIRAARTKISLEEEEDFKNVTTFNKLQVETPVMQQRLKAYYSNSYLRHAPIKQGQPPGFAFPADFCVGAIKIGDNIPQNAIGFIACPPGSRVVLYLTRNIEGWPDFLDKFGADELNGLELRTDKPRTILAKVRRFNNFDELCFFNSLLKAVPDVHHAKDQDNEASSDESVLSDAILPDIDRMANLKTLGLCGIHVSGKAITKMNLFKTVSCLKVKRVSDIETLLEALPERDNIKELWLVAQDLSDKQLEPLTRMKNLEKLRIRRSPFTIGCLDYFKRMKSLNSLVLDRIFTAEETEQLKQALPFYTEEAISDRTYWQLLPEKKKDQS